MSDADKPNKPGDGPKKPEPPRPRGSRGPRQESRLPRAALDFDPDELIDAAFRELAAERKPDTRIPTQPGAPEEAEEPEAAPEPEIEAIARLPGAPEREQTPPESAPRFPEHEPPTAAGWRHVRPGRDLESQSEVPTGRAPLPPWSAPATSVPATSVTASSVTASSVPPSGVPPSSEEGAPTIELSFETDFADPEDIAFAEGLAEQDELVEKVADAPFALTVRTGEPPEVATEVQGSEAEVEATDDIFDLLDGTELRSEPPVAPPTLVPDEVASLTRTSAQSFAVGSRAPGAPPRVETAPARRGQSPERNDPERASSDAPPKSVRPGAQTVWEARATWLEQEAQGLKDLHGQARTYLVASELWALAGNSVRAKAAAAEAHKLWGSFALAARQVRWLEAAEGDWTQVSAALEPETRAAPTAEARVHAANLHADVLALALDDRAQARRKIDLAVRAKPDDVRAHVARIVDMLGESGGMPRVIWPKEEVSPKLQAAVAELAVHRHGPLPEAATLLPEARSALEFERTRRYLDEGDHVAAAGAIEVLAGALGCSSGVGLWLSSALLASSAETRPSALAKLRELRTERPSPGVERALLARGLEQSDFGTVESALVALGEGLDLESRAALSALLGKVEARTLEELSQREALGPLQVALSAALGTDLPPSPHRLEQAPSPRLAAAALGRRAVRAKRGLTDELLPALEAYRRSPENPALAKLLGLELAHVAKDTNALSVELARSESGLLDPTFAERDRQLAAAFLCESTGNAEACVAHYVDANAADPTREAIARALIDYGGDRPKLLGPIAEACDDDVHSALLSLEVASSSSLDPGLVDVLLARATDCELVAPLAHHLGEWHTRHGRDTARLLGWLQARRQAADDPLERAIVLIREARVLARSDVTLAASLLEESSQLVPEDSALRRTYERTSPNLPPEARAAWREALAQRSDGVMRQWLYLEAALEYDRQGNAAKVVSTCRAALAAGRSSLAGAMLERARSRTEEAAELAEHLLLEAQKANEPSEQRELYERLSALDLRRGDRASARLWQSAILERNPDYLPALRHVEHAYLGGGRLGDLETCAWALSKLDDFSEANAHAWLSARIQTLSTGSPTREIADLVIARGNPPLWALRSRLDQARIDEDQPTLQMLYQLLLPHAPSKEDEATLALRAADAAAAQNRYDEADRLLGRALALFPEHPVALDRRAELYSATEQERLAAETLEALARSTVVDTHRAEAWFRAAETWEKVQVTEDPSDARERAKIALEQAVRASPRHAGAFLRLQSVYEAGGEQGRLAELLNTRLLASSDNAEKVPLEVARAKALADTGDREGALACLRRALDVSPEHMEALDLFADISFASEHWVDAESAWVSLARHLTDPAAQAETYRLLARLYEDHLPNLERAELACLEVQKRLPEDTEASEILVRVYSKTGQGEKAVQVQMQLFKGAKTEEARRDRILELAQLFESVVKQPSRAKQAYEQAHKVWPHDSLVLRAAAEYFARTGDLGTRHFMLDRAANDARRALGTGRFSASYFDLLAAVAELKQDADTAHVARATLAAILGKPETAPRGGGKAALDRTFDEGLAPELLTRAVRALIQRCGGYLDTAYPVALEELGLGSFTTHAPALAARVAELAECFGLPKVETHIASTPGVATIPIGGTPPRLVCTRELVELKDYRVRDFLLIKSLKILAAQASTLARTAAQDLGPMVSGWLEALAPNYHPDVADRARVEEYSRRIAQTIRGRLSADDTSLAIEVSHALGPRTGQLAMAVNRWGNRVALLSVGDPAAAFQALALTSGLPGGLPADENERLKWILRNPDARNLAVFAVGTRYAEERAKLGLSTGASPPPSGPLSPPISAQSPAQAPGAAVSQDRDIAHEEPAEAPLAGEERHDESQSEAIGGKSQSGAFAAESESGALGAESQSGAFAGESQSGELGGEPQNGELDGEPQRGELGGELQSEADLIEEAADEDVIEMESIPPEPAEPDGTAAVAESNPVEPTAAEERLGAQDAGEERVEAQDGSEEYLEQQNAGEERVEAQDAGGERVEEQGASEEHVEEQDAGGERVEEQGASEEHVEVAVDAHAEGGEAGVVAGSNEAFLEEEAAEAPSFEQGVIVDEPEATSSTPAKVSEMGSGETKRDDSDEPGSERGGAGSRG